jgi:hypothetical protein
MPRKRHCEQENLTSKALRETGGRVCYERIIRYFVQPQERNRGSRNYRRERQ